jgi:hypothetical protein
MKNFSSPWQWSAVLLIQPLYAEAQHASPPTGRSEKEKVKMQEKRAFEKDTDEALQGHD